VNAGYPERIIPAETPAGPVAAHVVRYRFAEDYCRGKDVLDAACGVGYGSHLLAAAARRVVGVDLADEAIEYARQHFKAENEEHHVMDVERMTFADDSFDVVCSFETIEHLPNPDRFVAEVARVLRPDGIFLVSTPKVAETDRNPANPFHTIEFSQADFESHLRKHFATVEILGQRRVQSRLHRALQRLDFLRLRTRVPDRLRKSVVQATGTIPWEDSGVADFVIDSQLAGATELVAVCRL
jgi:SAM-dependent methyltransferase